MKYLIVTKIPFYDTVLGRAFISEQVVEIANIERANVLVEAGLIAPYGVQEQPVKKTRKKKVAE